MNKKTGGLYSHPREKVKKAKASLTNLFAVLGKPSPSINNAMRATYSVAGSRIVTFLLPIYQ
jgi:hypothetical protein